MVARAVRHRPPSRRRQVLANADHVNRDGVNGVGTVGPGCRCKRMRHGVSRLIQPKRRTVKGGWVELRLVFPFQFMGFGRSWVLPEVRLCDVLTI